MKSRLLSFITLMAILLTGTISVHGLIPGDSDGDGIVDSLDTCPLEDASFFDRDGDGCIDPTPGARHTEYWGVDDAAILYVINETGTPGVGCGLGNHFGLQVAQPREQIGRAGLRTAHGGDDDAGVH